MKSSKTLREFLLEEVKINWWNSDPEKLAGILEEKYFIRPINHDLLVELLKEETMLIQTEVNKDISLIEPESVIKNYERSFDNQRCIAEKVNFEMGRIDCMDGYAFQDYVANLYRNLGKKVESKSKSKDQGVDFILDGYIGVQVKSSKRLIGNKAVQEIQAGLAYYNCKQGYVVANNYFTKEAIQLADANRIILINRDKLIALIYEFFNQSSENEFNIFKENNEKFLAFDSPRSKLFSK